MATETLLITAFNGFLMAGLTALVWTRFNRFEERFDRIDDRLDRLSEQVSVCATRAEVEGLRSDLTHVALAVGARRPRTAEG